MAIAEPRKIPKVEPRPVKFVPSTALPLLYRPTFDGELELLTNFLEVYGNGRPQESCSHLRGKTALKGDPPIIIIEFLLTLDNYTKAYEAFVSHHSNTV